MSCSENVTSKEQSVMEMQRQKTSGYEDEINLMDYFIVLWKHKYFIGFGALLPTLIVAAILLFCPKNYSVTYTYEIEDNGLYNGPNQVVHDKFNWGPNTKNFDVFCDIFYSQENISKLVNKLRENGMAKYADLMNKANTRKDIEKFAAFEIKSPYADLSKVNTTESAKSEQSKQLTVMLLKLTITGRLQNDILKIASVIRDNLENVIPVYFVGKELNASVQENRDEMAQIERERFNVNLALKKDRAILAKLKNIITQTSKSEENITLQFNVSDKSEYIPIAYQTQAAEAKVVQLEEQIAADSERYAYYKDLLTLNEKLSAEIKDKASSYYTIQQFQLFLTGFTDGCKNEGLKDYLNSYIKNISNRISASMPVTEKPRVYPVPVAKGTVKKIATAFAIALALSVFTAFLLEGLKKVKLKLLSS